MVLIDNNNVTRFSYLEYQALMVVLAGTMCAVMSMMEVAMSRFQVLPLLFPGMFEVRQRRFYIYSLDISDGLPGRCLRGEAKMLMRMTICVVMAYLWHFCVMETTQVVGSEFPNEACNRDFDCFASELHFITFLNRQHTAIDCSGSRQDFSQQLVVSCIRFVPPSATEWLKHLAIAHSVTQLNLKSYEVLVWVAGTSPRIRRLLGCLMVIFGITAVSLFFAGVLATFINSWLSFVMTLAAPVFMHTVWRSGHALQVVYGEDQERSHRRIETHLDQAFADIEAVVKSEAAASDDQPARGFSANRLPRIASGDASTGWASNSLVAGVRSLLATVGLIKKLPSHGSGDPALDPLTPVSSEAEGAPRLRSPRDAPSHASSEGSSLAHL